MRAFFNRILYELVWWLFRPFNRLIRYSCAPSPLIEGLKLDANRPIVYVPQLLSLVSGLTMPFLEVIPFSSSVVASGVSMLALSLLTRDGLFFLLALLPYAAVGYLGVRLLA